MRFLPTLLLAAVASAQPQAADVLAKVAHTYLHLRAIHVVAERKDSLFQPGGAQLSETTYELAAKPPGRFRAWIRLADKEGLAVSDGSTTWKALPKSKLWMKQEVAAADDADSSEAEPGTAQASHDLRGVLLRTLISRYIALAQSGEWPQIAREETYTLGPDKIPCFVITVRTQNVAHEVWVDQSRYLVLRHIQTARAPGEGTPATSRVEVKIKRLEIDDAVDDSLFTWAPQKKWTEVESLVLPQEQPEMLSGMPAGDFQLKTVSGEVVRLSELRGTVVVLDFWDTWCGPCRRELPAVEKLRAEFAGKVQFFGVNDEEQSTVAAFLKKAGYELPVLMDTRHDVHRQYGIHGVPTVFVIGRDGIVRQHYVGAQDESTLRRAIREALRGA